MRLSTWATLFPVIGVEDLERTTRFYTGLGFRVVRSGETCDGRLAFTHFRLGSVELMSFALEYATSGMPDRAARKKMHLYVAVSDIDALSAELRIRRIRVTPIVTVDGARYCDVEDPDGYLLRFGTVTDPVPFHDRLIPAQHRNSAATPRG